MARKPNYAFERNAKAKAKAEKREAKRQAKLAAKVESKSRRRTTMIARPIPGRMTPGRTALPSAWSTDGWSGQRPRGL